MRSRIGKVFLGLLTAGVMVYLGGGIAGPLHFVVFAAVILFPAAALFARFPAARELSPGSRVVLGFALTLIATTPLYYFRRALPISGWAADGAIAAILLIAAIGSGAYRQWIADLRCEQVRSIFPWIFAVIPIAFASVWMGHEVIRGGQVLYFRLYPIDFYNLSSVIPLINNVRGLPQRPLAGTGSLDYHWLYYTFPAWVSEFGGGNLRAIHAQILCNYLTSCILFLALCEIARGARMMTRKANEVMASPITPRMAALVAALILFASPTMTIYGEVVARLHFTWLRSEESLFITMVKNMIFFANNAAAIIFALLVGILLPAWNRTGRWFHWIAICVLVTMTIPFSVTLFLPLAGAVGALIICGRVRGTLVAAAAAGAIGAAGLGAMFAIHLFGNQGGHILARFDRGQFLQNLVFGWAPLAFLALVGLRHTRGAAFFALLAFATAIEGSFVHIDHSIRADFTQKSAGLAAAALTPFVAMGVYQIRSRRMRIAGIISALLLLVGLAHTAVFVLEFPAFAWSRGATPSMVLPIDYFHALTYLRTKTARQAIIIDPNNEVGADTVPTLPIGERRFFLPVTYVGANQMSEDIHNPELDRRTQRFRAWKESGFTNSAASRYFADAADYFLVADDPVRDENWVKVMRFGALSLYRSTRRNVL